MSDIVRRFVSAASYATGPSRAGKVSQLEPNIFAGVADLCSEIGDLGIEIQTAAVKLRIARATGNRAWMLEALAEIMQAEVVLTRKCGAVAGVMNWENDFHKNNAGASDGR